MVYRGSQRNALMFGLAAVALCVVLIAPSPVFATTFVPSAVQAGLGTVVIDAGHQADADQRSEPIGPGSSQTKPRVESGTEGVVTHAPESRINLEVALKLQKTLEARGVNVVMVRTTQDVNISNSQRAQIANDNNATLFVRLHCDGVGSSSVHGLLMLRPGSNQWTGPIVAPSKTAAAMVGESTLAATGASDRGTTARTDLTGFNWSKVPAILVEMGVMTNATEDRKLSTASYQQALADGMTNGIVAYLASVHHVTAAIDSVSPSPATTDTPVTFAGHAADSAGHTISAWQWRSTIDGALDTRPSFTHTLSPGIHAIFLKGMCSQGMWSPEVGTWLVVGAAGTKPQAVYRFYNPATGVHFYTASEAEKNSVAAKLSSTFAFEGVAYAPDTSAPANNAPLYRFYDFTRGVHFYTASDAEKNRVLATLGSVYRYEGVAFNVSLTPAGGQPVYRFYNFKKGVHFYTASLAERDAVVRLLGYTYRYEGVAYHYVRSW